MPHNRTSKGKIRKAETKFMDGAHASKRAAVARKKANAEASMNIPGAWMGEPPRKLR